MKPLLLLLLAISISLTSLAAFSSAATVATTTEPTPVLNQQNTIAFNKLTVKEIQVFLGRKLTLKEKVQWMLAKKLVGKLDPVDEELAKKGRTKAYLGFAFGLASILIFPLFAIPGLIFSNQAMSFHRVDNGILGDAKGFAKAGQILSWVGIAIMLFVLLLVLAYASSLN